MAFISFNCYKNKKGQKKNELSKQNDTISWSRPLVDGGNVGNVAIIVHMLRESSFNMTRGGGGIKILRGGTENF